MKKVVYFFTCVIISLMAVSCSQGAAAIDKAYEQACDATSAITVATTLCNGDINCSTLTPDEACKLGAVLGYITYHGLYTRDFEAQVDMYQFKKLVEGYREIEKNQTGTERLKVEELTKQIMVTQ